MRMSSYFNRGAFLDIRYVLRYQTLSLIQAVLKLIYAIVNSASEDFCDGASHRLKQFSAILLCQAILFFAVSAAIKLFLVQNKLCL